ncbi:hypothetical protein ACFVTT_15710 [Streptomyces niveus]|uniref:hypothetical protein n=1 Tax=Streptomyces niveus TaxID=193462 RepID=UPI0034422EB0
MHDEHDEMSNDDLLTGAERDELREASELQLDANQEARDAEAIAAEADQDDGEPWTGYADGEER